MKVCLADIPPEGLNVTFTDTRARPEDFGPQVEAVVEAPRARMVVERSGDVITARGDYTAQLALACSRCLQPYPLELAGEFSLAFRPQPDEESEEIHLAGDDLEVVFFAGEEIDLARALRDEVSLALPMVPLCAPDCAGLCPKCGKPVKPGEVCCADSAVDPRWAKLAKLKE